MFKVLPLAISSALMASMLMSNAVMAQSIAQEMATQQECRTGAIAAGEIYSATNECQGIEMPDNLASAVFLCRDKLGWSALDFQELSDNGATTWSGIKASRGLAKACQDIKGVAPAVFSAIFSN